MTLVPEGAPLTANFLMKRITTRAKNGPFAQRPYNGFISAVTGSILQFLAFWAFISWHFGLVGLHFLAFWPCGPSFPCILALWGLKLSLAVVHV